MQHIVRCFAAAAFLVAGSTLSAQQPMPGPGGPPPGAAMNGQGPMAGASFLLARTGDLQLTDQQVVRLAAIARREGARRKSLMATVDSVRRSGAAIRRDSAGPRRINPQLEARMRQVGEQARTDLRDAIAVLTPDQQAQAWTMVSRGGAMQRQGGMRDRMRGGRERGERGMRMREGRPGGMQPRQPGLAPRGRAGGAPAPGRRPVE